jgi:hypothetical protein
MCVLRSLKYGHAVVFVRSPFTSREPPSGLVDPCLGDSIGKAYGVDNFPGKFADARQGRRVSALCEEDRTMLHERAALSSLGATKNLVRTDQEIHGGVLVEAE